MPPLQTLKETSARAADTEKKRTSLSRTEDQLTAQLAKLQKESQETKARLGQQAAQYKSLQARVASLETANQALDQKLKDADAEVEMAHKSCREHQFRIKQLQEEVVFLERRRKADTAVKDAVKEVIEGPEAPSAALVLSMPPQQQEDDDADIPAWMK
jgi:chromosome segregation ATPase